tara:strand:- start:226 stop:465 length:240 start_codon:yes stop_codon:yes gene_type:complete
MTADQNLAFWEGTGEFFTANDALFTAQAIGATAVFLWLAWLCVTAYKEWGAEAITQGEMIAVWFRGLLMMMILLTLFTI